MLPILCLLFSSSFLIAPSVGQNMIPGPIPIANAYSGYEIGKYRGDYFEVYSLPMSTQYSEVYWRVQQNIPLPDKIVAAFNNSIMAITGYEVDIIRKTANGDVGVPCYEQYNHHYVAYIQDNQTLTEEEGEFDHHQFGAIHHKTLPRHKTSTSGSHNHLRSSDQPTIPLTQLFSEGNGGEMRLSFHGYPLNTAQLVESPDIFKLQPMMINTKSPTGVRGGPLPISNNIWPNNSLASGLVECPCTTRISKVPANPTTQSTGACWKNYTTPQDCFNAALQLGIKASSNNTVSDNTLPGGCTVRTGGTSGAQAVTFNSLNTSAIPCGAGSSLSNASGQKQSINLLQVDLVGQTNIATITLSGKDGVWFGVGFNATLMQDAPYALIVDGYGKVTERKLAEHDPGVELTPSITLVSSTAKDGLRTVIVTRPFQGKDQNYYTFSLQTSSFNFINAVGSTPDLSYHFNRTGDVLNMALTDADMCLCPGHGGNIGGVPFGENCYPEPYGDLLVQNNPSCFFETFNGGLQCCFDGDFLLDAEQTIPPAVDTFYMKYRFYYEPYNPTLHRNLVRIYFQTEYWQGEYDIIQCPKGTPPQECVHTITAHFTLRDIISDCDQRTNAWCLDSKQIGPKGLNLIYAAGHCHAPMCIDMELYDQSTGTLLCRNAPFFGKSDAVYDEAGYILGIPPCLYGSASEGLPPPPVILLDTPLMAIKRANNSYAHYGDMASWQMRGAYIY